jgi:tetratricopeptide (TPR) repeat protein
MTAADPSALQGPNAAPARRRWWLLGLLALSGLVAAGVGYYAWRNRGPARPDVPAVNLDGADPEIAEVVTKARAAVVKSPRSAEAWGELAMVLHAHGYHHEAGRAYAAAAALAPDDAAWPYLHGVTLHVGGADPQSALPFLRKAAELSDRYPARARLGEVLLELGRPDQAEAEFNEALATNPDDARALFGLAQVATARQDFRAALRHLDAVSHRRHTRKQACAQRAALYGRLGDQDAVRREQRRLAQLDLDAPWPDEGLERVFALQAGVDARLNRAGVLEKQGRLPEAIALLEATTALYPRSDAAWSNLGQALVQARDFAGADRALRKNLELAPQKAENWLIFAGMQMTRRRYKDAEQAFRKAIDLTPANVVAHLGLGDSLRAQGDRDGAAAAYREALRHRPHADEIRQRLAELADER